MCRARKQFNSSLQLVNHTLKNCFKLADSPVPKAAAIIKTPGNKLHRMLHRYWTNRLASGPYKTNGRIEKLLRTSSSVCCSVCPFWHTFTYGRSYPWLMFAGIRCLQNYAAVANEPKYYVMSRVMFSKQLWSNVRFSNNSGET